MHRTVVRFWEQSRSESVSTGYSVHIWVWIQFFDRNLLHMHQWSITFGRWRHCDRTSWTCSMDV